MKKERNYSLDFIKIVATVGIICAHFQQLTGARYDFGINYLDGRFFFGYLVEVFFFISGFVMCGYIGKIQNGLSFKEFYLKRYSRLFPVMVSSIIVYEVLDIIFRLQTGAYFAGGKVTLWGALVSILGFQCGWVTPNVAINNPLWYVSVLLLCYVVFYLTVWLSSRLKTSVVYLHIAMIFLGRAVMNYHLEAPFLNSSAARGYIAFFAGLILAQLLSGKKVSRSLGLLGGAVFAGSVAVMVVAPNIIGCTGNTIMSDTSAFVSTVVSCSLIVFFSMKEVSDLFRSEKLGTLGKIAFNAFVWHVPLILLLNVIMNAAGISIECPSKLMMYGFVVLSFIIAAFSYRFLEKPAQKVLDRMLAKILN